MSIFIATLAFGSVDEQVISKMAVLAASVLAGVSGYCFIRWLSSNPGAGGNPGPRVS
jgi:Na+/H+ antiporter NhaA